jgi:hypothetical protein
VVSFTPRPLYPQGKSPWYPLERRLGGPQSRSGRDGLEKNSQPPSGIKPQNPDRSARSPALYRLSYHGSYCFFIVYKYLSSKQETQGRAYDAYFPSNTLLHNLFLSFFFSNWLLQSFIGPWPSLMDFSIHRHLVGLLGWGISPTQGLYRNT